MHGLIAEMYTSYLCAFEQMRPRRSCLDIKERAAFVFIVTSKTAALIDECLLIRISFEQLHILCLVGEEAKLFDRRMGWN